MKKGDTVFVARITTDDTAEVNFVGEEVYESMKKAGDPYAMKLKVIE